MYTATGNLIPQAPFDYKKSLDFLDRFGPLQGEQMLSAQTLTKAFALNGQVILGHLAFAGTVEAPQADYTLFSQQPLPPTLQQRSVERMSFFLSLEDDLRLFYEIGRSDSAFEPVLETLYGYHQVKFPTPFEAACWAVLVQRNPSTIAQRMKGDLTKTYGGRVDRDGVTYWAFPEAEQIAQESEASLLQVVRNARKAAYLVAVSRAFSGIDESFLRAAPYEEVAHWLRSIKGFGEWSTTFVLLRGLGRMEQVPFSEKPFLEAASRVYGHAPDFGRKDVMQHARTYGDFQGYWAHYLRVSG